MNWGAWDCGNPIAGNKYNLFKFQNIIINKKKAKNQLNQGSPASKINNPNFLKNLILGKIYWGKSHLWYRLVLKDDTKK